MYSNLKYFIPTCFFVGGSMELFMINTGFYDIVTKKEGERMLARKAEEERQFNRLKELNIKLPNISNNDIK